MKDTLSAKQSSLESFQNWFNFWHKPLWAFVHFRSLNDDEFQDEFIYTLAAARNRISKKFSEDQSGIKATAEFLKIWFTRLKKRRQHSSLGQNEIDWQDQFILFSLLKMDWSTAEISALLKLSPASIQYRFFKALCKESALSEQNLATRTRECVRFELFFGDIYLNKSWDDPLTLVNVSELNAHAQSCPRCSKIKIELAQTCQRLQDKPLALVPSEFHNEVHEELGTRWNLLFAGEWFRHLHWAIKLPLQAALVLGTLILVLNGARFKQKIVDSAPFFENYWNQAKSLWPDQKPIQTSSNGEDVKTNSTEIPIEFREPLVNSLEKFLSRVAPSAAPLEVISPSPVTQAVISGGSSKHLESTIENIPNEKNFFRWSASSTQIEQDVQAVKKILEKYSALKTGELDFGVDNRGAKYFHFSVSKEDLEKVTNEIRALNVQAFRSELSTSWRSTPLHLSRVVFLLKESKVLVKPVSQSTRDKEASASQPQNENSREAAPLTTNPSATPQETSAEASGTTSP